MGKRFDPMVTIGRKSSLAGALRSLRRGRHGRSSVRLVGTFQQPLPAIRQVSLKEKEKLLQLLLAQRLYWDRFEEGYGPEKKAEILGDVIKKCGFGSKLSRKYVRDFFSRQMKEYFTTREKMEKDKEMKPPIVNLYKVINEYLSKVASFVKSKPVNDNVVDEKKGYDAVTKEYAAPVVNKVSVDDLVRVDNPVSVDNPVKMDNPVSVVTNVSMDNAVRVDNNAQIPEPKPLKEMYAEYRYFLKEQDEAKPFAWSLERFTSLFREHDSDPKVQSLIIENLEKCAKKTKRDVRKQLPKENSGVKNKDENKKL